MVSPLSQEMLPQVVASTPANDIPQTGVRLFFLDHLRVWLTMLVIMHHLSLTYALIAPWYYMEPPTDPITSPLLLLFVLLNQAYFMGCFFLIAGYVTPASYERKGAGIFLRDRLLRLGMPLLIFVALLAPLTSAIGYSSIISLIGPQPPMTPWQYYLGTISPGPLWFLEALLIFALLYALWRVMARQQPPTPQTDRPLPSFGAIVAFVLLLAVVTFVWRIWIPIGWTLPFLSFPTMGHLSQYIGLFVIGIVAYRRNWLLRIPDKAGRIGWLAAISSTVLLLGIILTNMEAFLTTFSGGLQWPAAVYASWEAIFCVGMVLGLLTLFRSRFNRQRTLGKFLSANAYAAYVVHAPVIVALAYGLRDLHIFPLLKFAVAVIIAILLCFGVAAVVRKFPGAQNIL